MRKANLEKIKTSKLAELVQMHLYFGNVEAYERGARELEERGLKIS